MSARNGVLPLAGRTLVITRSRAQASTLVDSLAGLGARVIEIPTIAIAPPVDYAALDNALGRLDSYDWLLVTSANTARVIGDRLTLLAERRQPTRVGAVGRATADALVTVGLRVDLVPQPFVAEAMIAALKHEVAGKRILLARAAVAREVLPDGLREAGAEVDIVDAYRTILPEDSLELLRQAFASGAPPNGITFTSSSTVTNFLALLNAAGLERPAGLPAFSIGPITSATLRAHDWEPAAEAREHDIAGLVDVVLATLRPSPR